MWQSSPHIILPNNIRTNSVHSNGSSFVPEIVISNSDDGAGPYKRNNSYTPSLSLIYDFGNPHSRKNSNFSEFSETFDLSQFNSDLSIESEEPLNSLTNSSFESHERTRHASLNI
uniref:Uncharacterized protein n=1 Tax=Acrobeloides nanus TaxID=290746 RepID=A0A914E4G4_9BILA